MEMWIGQIHVHGHACRSRLPHLSHAGTPGRGRSFFCPRDGALPAQTHETKGRKSRVIFCLVSRQRPCTHSPQRGTLRSPSSRTPAHLALDSRCVDALFAGSQAGKEETGSGEQLRGSADRNRVSLSPLKILKPARFPGRKWHPGDGGKLAVFTELPPLPVMILHLVSNCRKEVNHSP